MKPDIVGAETGLYQFTARCRIYRSYKYQAACSHQSRIEKLRPCQMYTRLLYIVKRKEDANFNNKYFDRFVREVALQAKVMETEQRVVPFYNNRVEKEGISTTRKVTHQDRSVLSRTVVITSLQHHQDIKVQTDVRGIKRKRDVLKALFCVSPVCRADKTRLYTSHCDLSDKNTNSALLKHGLYIFV